MKRVRERVRRREKWLNTAIVAFHPVIENFYITSITNYRLRRFQFTANDIK